MKIQILVIFAFFFTVNAAFSVNFLATPFITPVCSYTMPPAQTQDPTPTPFPTPTGTPSNIVHVPSEYPQIQWAMDVVAEGGEVIVSPGCYKENLNFKGKNLKLRSSDPNNASIVEATIIDGSENSSVVIFSGSENSSTLISGFTITHGFAKRGAGIYGNGTKATISRNIISFNRAYHSDDIFAISIGGAIYQCNGLIEYNIIKNNKAEAIGISFAGAWAEGGGLADCNGVIQYNTITQNSASVALWQQFLSEVAVGGGLWGCHGRIEGNIISKNYVSSSGYLHQYSVVGGEGIYGCNGVIIGNIISENINSSKPSSGVDSCKGSILNNMLYHNNARLCGGSFVNNTVFTTGTCLYDCEGIIKNCILWNIEGKCLDRCSTPSWSCIRMWSGGIGNISLDPLFLDPENGDLHLLPGSTCIDAASLTDMISFDFEGDVRPVNGSEEERGDGSDFDMGADEFGGYTGRQEIINHILGIRKIPFFRCHEADKNNDGIIDVADVFFCINPD
jgi:hypothetical protein